MIELTLFLVTFLAGAAAATLVVLRVGINLEDRYVTLRGAPPTRLAAAARWITGLYVRMPPPEVTEQETAGEERTPVRAGE